MLHLPALGEGECILDVDEQPPPVAALPLKIRLA
jgi:hypothetical protein